MGFLDKAKKMAEQAQAKLDEAQTKFNEKQGAAGGPGGAVTEYDSHGRPVQPSPGEVGGEVSVAPPASRPHGDPLAGGPSEAPIPPAPPAPPVVEPPATAQPPAHEAPPAQPQPAGPAPPPQPAAAAAPPPPPAPQEAPEDNDPNNPNYEPPKLSSGDPLAG
jgi:hypothetical protein